MIYRAEIKSIVNQSKTYVLSSTAEADLIIRDLSIQYNYLSYSNPGQLMVVGFKNKAIPQDAIKSGDIIFLYENNVRIFVGYILSVTTEVMATRFVQYISFDSILSQWSRQMMISSANDVVVTIKPDSKPSTINNSIVSSTLRMQQLINFMIKDSIFEYAKKNYQFDTPQAKFGIIYENETLLNSKTEVYYFPATNTTKQQVMNTVLYPFQQILYQDPSGNVRFSTPSYSNKTNLNVDQNTSIYIKLQFFEKQVEVTNFVVSTLAYLGFFPTFTDKSLNVTAVSKPNPKYFPYLNQLLETGFFTQSLVDPRDLGTDTMRNPVLLNVITNLENNKTLQTLFNIPPNALKTKTIAALFSNRRLAESLINARNVSVELVRTPEYTDIPVGKIFQVNNESWIAITVNLNLTAMDNGSVINTISLFGAPLSSCTGAWQK